MLPLTFDLWSLTIDHSLTGLKTITYWVTYALSTHTSPATTADGICGSEAIEKKSDLLHAVGNIKVFCSNKVFGS